MACAILVACEMLPILLRQCGPGRFHVRRARLELVQAIDLLADPLEGGSKDLLAPQRLIGGKLLPRGSGFPRNSRCFCLASARTLSRCSQAQLQRMQLVSGGLVDGGRALPLPGGSGQHSLQIRLGNVQQGLSHRGRSIELDRPNQSAPGMPRQIARQQDLHYLGDGRLARSQPEGKGSAPHRGPRAVNAM
jgi:hypothetical protein